MKLWTGRFSRETDKTAGDFNSSIATDSRMFREDIDASVAHASMLAACGIITKEDGEAITRELKTLKAQFESGELAVDPDCEDIHTFIEAQLTERLGDAGKRVHTARSRNDQVAADIRLYLKKESAAVSEKLNALIGVVDSRAAQYAGTVMPGYTHLQRAQPVTFGAHLSAYSQMFRRDSGRLADAVKRMDFCPLGSGALAGTTYPVDREMTAAYLGFSGVVSNTLDAVSDRDFCMELAAVLSIIMVHLSRFCEEIVLWCSWEFGFIELDDAFATGSSIMPQKKNPDIAELVRGKTGRVFGDLTALLTVMKGLPLAYNKDMQEDKDAIFDAFDTVKMCLDAFTPMLATMKAREKNMLAAASGGFINATDCADYLVSKGLPFRDAYKATGELVAVCIGLGLTLETLPLEEYKKACPLFDEGVYEAVKLENCLKKRGLIPPRSKP
ncbi:MAG TPA: argininosuccinate lyase [Clostridiales bacterium]|nr:MAG: Argininosuccinate lyase 1 [Firmicutes bacterium ADurb.Bin262]HOU10007.1 argininosuccinate lyase [Clostridiales bacterium]HQK72423.1 argininosuccinate lyase [Clostridiales bacterium]